MIKFYSFNLLMSFAFSYIFTIICIKIAKKYNLVDLPDKRKIHKKPVPYLGGVAIFCSFFLIYIISYILFPHAKLLNQYVGLIAASFVIFFLGLYDDFKGAKAPVKFIIQIIAALIIINSDLIIDKITNPLGGSFYFPEWISCLATIFWIVAIINAVNLLDGLDGLASGVITIASIFVFIIAILQKYTAVAHLAILLIGANLGFLIFNIYPAKIIMGDTGSMFLGMIFAVMAIAGNRKSAFAINLLIPIVLLTIPIIDTLLAILRRASKRINIFQADKEHIHHRLLSLGIPYQKVINLIYLFCFYLGLISLLSLKVPKEFTLILLLIVGINIFIGIYILILVEKHIKKSK